MTSSVQENYHANVNQRLIENISQNSPLHDGAMIIRHKRIEAAGCILPVSHDLNIPKELGLRHRAAMGVSQETDALAIIVSEETGGISVAYKRTIPSQTDCRRAGTYSDKRRLITYPDFYSTDYQS